MPIPRLPVIDDLFALSKLALNTKGTFRSLQVCAMCSAIIMAWSRDSI